MGDYKESGVNIELGDEASKIFYEAAKQTWKNREGKLGEIVEILPDFSGVRGINVGELPKGIYMSLGFDGIGTKAEIAERTNKHNTMAYDLFAMVCDDAVREGFEPVIIGSVFDAQSLGEDKENYLSIVRKIADGYISAAKEANVGVINGEVAELGARVNGYGPFNYNWAAGVVWFANKDRIITGRKIKPKDTLVGLKEEGFRSNGLSLVREIMKTTHGDNWHEVIYNGKNLGEGILQPSRIYTRAVAEMFGGFDNEPKANINGIAHITGGGIPGKLGRILKPNNLGVDIEDPFEPCELMIYCQEKGDVADYEAYRTWNMGQGMIIVTPEPDEVMNVAGKYNIDSKVIGEISQKPGIRIKSKGLNSEYTEELVF